VDLNTKKETFNVAFCTFTVALASFIHLDLLRITLKVGSLVSKPVLHSKVVWVSKVYPSGVPKLN
jgi:hypothetical protein